MGRLAALLAQWKAYPRGIEPGLPVFWDDRTFLTAPVMTLECTEGAIDLLDEIAGVGKYADVRRQSEPVELFDMTLRVLSLRAIVAAKRASARPKDLAQLPELEALLALKRATRK